MVGVCSNSEMETFFTGVLDQVSDICISELALLYPPRGDSLVCANTSSFKRLRTQLFIFVGDHVNAERKFIDIGTLTTKIEDTNLWIGDTTVESRLRIRLEKVFCKFMIPHHR